MLDAEWPLDGTDLRYDGIVILAVTRAGLVAVSMPKDGEKAVSDTVRTRLNADLPDVGASVATEDGSRRLLRLGRDELLLLIEDFVVDPIASAREIFGPTATFADQTDSYAMLDISGGRSLQALERMCPLDLHPQAFGQNRVSRTVMEHLDVIIVRTGHDKYLLMSPRSTAKNFLHAVQTSAENVT